jgi:hypothetical protein
MNRRARHAQEYATGATRSRGHEMCSDEHPWACLTGCYAPATVVAYWEVGTP